MNAKLPFLILLMTACADGTVTTDKDTDTDADTDFDTDRPVNNPRNPLADGPAPVDLGGTEDGAANYVLLAKTSITNVTGSTITGGDVGLSPAAASFITGMSLVMDPSGAYATSVSLTSPGKVLAADYAVPTPTLLTTGVLAMEAAYTDAAGRWPPDELNLSSGNLGGLTLAPGLYTWGSTVTIPTDLTLSGGADDVWILQVTGDLDLGTGTQVVLAGGAVARNITWQVAGEATVHANAHFAGVLLGKTGVTLQTNATVDGRLMAQSMIALDDNVVTAP